MSSKVEKRLMEPRVYWEKKGLINKKKVVYPKYTGGVDKHIEKNITFLV